jgi:NADH-quinone oxidoreductase subunit L
MNTMASILWLIPVLPLVAAGVIALLPRAQRVAAAALAIGAMSASLGLSLIAFVQVAQAVAHGDASRLPRHFEWLSLGQASLHLGWVLDPLSAAMVLMVTFVGLLIFIYSVGYMAHDPNFTRFFCFLALFGAAMLGLVISNHLLLLFICWELVGVASYLLIGFWYHKPSAAAAAKKAFITTRIGDLGLFFGLLWLYARTGTLEFYSGGAGQGCLEPAILDALVSQTTILGIGLSTAIGVLLFCGAAGKSGQVPLHVWLPDAMEGPTPVSALIHAATMVAAGVFLMARVHPLLAAHAPGTPAETGALQVVTWMGGITAVFAASIAVAQSDIKRILAYSTVSQLGFMMLGLGTGGVAVGMFHLITHAFFKALLFLGAGSVIHAAHEEQDIRRLGGLRKLLPVTFATYAVGMMALAGVPVFFAGFWSKDAILHAAHRWPVSHGPFYLGLVGAVLTAFYMTRQMCYVFFGPSRIASRAAAHPQGAAEHGVGGLPAGASPGSRAVAASHSKAEDAHKTTRGEKGSQHRRRNAGGGDGSQAHAHGGGGIHESPPVMTVPLALLAVCAVLLGFLGTPAWPWFQSFVAGEAAGVHMGHLVEWETLSLMLGSAVLVLGGIGLGWWFYGRLPLKRADAPDPIESRHPALFRVLRDKYYVDELYEATFIRAYRFWALACAAFDRWLWGGAVLAVRGLTTGVAWASHFCDEFVVNMGFDGVCRGLRIGGGSAADLQDGQVQNSLRALALGLAVLAMLLIWGTRG